MLCLVDNEANSWLSHTDRNCYIPSKVVSAIFRAVINARNKVITVIRVAQSCTWKFISPLLVQGVHASCCCVPVVLAGCSLINCNHTVSNTAPSDLDSQYLGEMLHGSWKWLIRIGTACCPNILKFSLKNQNLIVTPHSSLWYLSTTISSRIPATAGFNEESLRVRGRRVTAGEDHAASSVWAYEKFVAEVGPQLLPNGKGSCDQQTKIRFLKPWGCAPEYLYKHAISPRCIK